MFPARMDDQYRKRVWVLGDRTFKISGVGTRPAVGRRDGLDNGQFGLEVLGQTDKGVPFGDIVPTVYS